MTSKGEPDLAEPWHLRILRRKLTHFALAALLLVLDYATGEVIQFPIAFVIPVALASWFCTPGTGYGLAVVMPAGRLLFPFLWESRLSLDHAIANVTIRVAVLLFIAFLTSKAARLTREVKLLKGILPVCSFCKNIRDSEGKWESIEAYITQRTDADFSHGVCPKCAQIHYAELLNEPGDF